MPISGCIFSNSAVSMNSPSAARLPGKPGVRRDSAISQAETIIKPGRRNSLGWMVKPGSAIQRCAPSTSTPCISVKPVSRKNKIPIPNAANFTCRSDSMEIPSIVAAPKPRNRICLTMIMVCGSVSRSEMPGVAASAIT